MVTKKYQHWFYQFSIGVVSALILCLIFGLWLGLRAALIGMTLGLVSGLSDKIEQTEQFRFSYDLDKLIGGLYAALIIGFSIWIVVVFGFGKLIGFPYSVRNGLILAMIFGLCMSISQILQIKPLAESSYPNQGFQRLWQNGLISGVIISVFGASIGWLSDWLIDKAAKTHDIQSIIESIYPNLVFRSVEQNGPIFGLGVGLIFGFFVYGGLSAIHYIVLRIFLYCYGYIPLNYAHFLDHCAERIFLRKVGGGYIFVHRLVLEYFAGLASNPASPSLED